MVKSTDSGLAVPDWPTSFGVWMPPMVGGVFYEHGHRMVALAAGFLVLGLALLAGFREPRPWVRWVAWGSLIAVVAQALLGAFTVLVATQLGWERTSPLLSTLHGALAQLLFGLLISLATVTAPGWHKATKAKNDSSGLIKQTAWVCGLIYVQIVIGAVMRNHDAGLIISDFPTSYGKLVPEFHEWRVVVNYAHRVGAVLTLGAVLILGSRVAFNRANSAWLRHTAWALLVAVLLQFTLGAFTVWTGLNPLVTSFHVIGGAAVFTGSVVLALRLWRSVSA